MTGQGLEGILGLGLVHLPAFFLLLAPCLAACLTSVITLHCAGKIAAQWESRRACSEPIEGAGERAPSFHSGQALRYVIGSGPFLSHFPRRTSLQQAKAGGRPCRSLCRKAAFRRAASRTRRSRMIRVNNLALRDCAYAAQSHLEGQAGRVV
jgi:hypothetical protein